MKSVLLFLLSSLAINTSAQKITAPSGGGEYVIARSACVSEQRRAEIQNMLQENIAMLKAKGILAKDWGATPKAKQKTTAGTFNWPLQQQPGFSYNSVYGISNYVDLNFAFPNFLLDWNCGARTYDLSSGYNHGGTDIFLWPFPQMMQNAQQVAIISAAPGVIIGKDNGNFDHNCAMGSSNWNAVYIGNTDGTICWYGHMQNGTQTTKAVGQTVVQGEFLGYVGSSGSSTGPHLHFEVHDNNGNVLDPFAGPCNNTIASSLWAAQKPYNEPTINALLTHSAPPVYPNCPAVEVVNAKDTFNLGESLYLASYFHDQNDDTVYYKVIDPSSNVADAWPHALNPGQVYTASYWYWIKMVTPGMVPGAWKFTATYKGNSVTKNFWINDPLAVSSINNPLSNITVSPNPVQGRLRISGLPEETHHYRLIVRDALGNKIAEQQFAGIRNQLEYYLNADNGFYLLSIINEAGQETRLKLVKTGR